MEESGRAVGAYLGARLRRIRRWQDLSQTELAHHAEVHRTQISLIEGGERVPRVDTLIKLAGGFLIPTGGLLDGIAWEPPGGGRPGRMVEVEPEGDG
jgi:transcriptional regulator with XRE-family HTH domain